MANFEGGEEIEGKEEEDDEPDEDEEDDPQGELGRFKEASSDEWITPTIACERISIVGRDSSRMSSSTHSPVFILMIRSGGGYSLKWRGFFH